MSVELHHYLNFPGTAAEAMAHYADALGGTVSIMRYGDSPEPVDPEHKDKVMHATLTAGNLRLMAADTIPPYPAPVNGTSMYLSLNFTDDATQDAVWAKLAVGGQVVMPLTELFFGRFGILLDRYGMQWMLHKGAQ